MQLFIESPCGLTVHRVEVVQGWQTNATVASVSGASLLLDGLDRQVPAAASELKSVGEGRWMLDWEVRRRP